MWPARAIATYESADGNRAISRVVGEGADELAGRSFCDDLSVKLWSLPDGALLKTLTGHSGLVRAVAISPDGTLLVSGSSDKIVRLWSLPDGTLLSGLVDPKCGNTIAATCSPSDGATVGCSCDAVCTCNSVCTCDTVCTCDSEGSDWG